MSGRSVIPNALSCMRLLCVPVVLISPPNFRLLLLFFASLTDILDGYLARRWNVTSALGTILDPLGDMGLAIACAYLFWSEGLLNPIQIMFFFSRDIALLLFTSCLIVLGKHKQWRIQSFWCGKAATMLQAVAVAWMCYGKAVPALVYSLLVLTGLLALPELVYRMKLGSTQLRQPD